MRAQRNKVECMLTSICCHNRFGFFSFGMDPCPPSPHGAGRAAAMLRQSH